MFHNTALIIANSVYQLLTAIHIKNALLPGQEADILVTDATPALQSYLPRLRETGLFHRVIRGLTAAINRQYGAKIEKINEAFQNAGSLLRWALSDELAEYAQVYFANFDLFTRMLAARLGENCAFTGFEDGFSSYVINFLREDRAPVNRHPAGIKIKEKLHKMLLYEPRLAMRGDGLPNLPLPKIPRRDPGLRELYNYVFDYKPLQEGADFIFLEQSFAADGIKSNDLDLMKECQQAVGPGRFLVKPHPRNPENRPFALGLSRKYASAAPWELTLMNEDVQNKTLITVCSNAALTGRIVFGLDLNTVMLYRLFQGKVLWKEDAVLWRYLLKFRRQFAGGNYYVPQTVYELRNILHYLGGEGRHEPTCSTC